MKINFEKYHGTGNDFILIDQSESVFDLSIEQVKFLCDRHFGIGADGLIMIRKHASSDFEMIYFNSDGREGTMCGNGGRCAVAFALSKGLTKSDSVFYAYDGLHTASINKENGKSSVKLKMSDVKDIEVNTNGFYLNTGSPHYVIFSDRVNETDVYVEGRKIRHNQRFLDEGTNVNFVELNNGGLIVRTYERGVEDETLSCGTGVVASSIAAFVAGKGVTSPVVVQTPGGTLKVEFVSGEKKFTDITLEGPAEKVFEGSIYL